MKSIAVTFLSFLRFYSQTGFPGVIGAIDCTHVKIQNPGKDIEHCYFNRKGHISKNVQLVSYLINSKQVRMFHMIFPHRFVIRI